VKVQGAYISFGGPNSSRSWHDDPTDNRRTMNQCTLVMQAGGEVAKIREGKKGRVGGMDSSGSPTNGQHSVAKVQTQPK